MTLADVEALLDARIDPIAEKLDKFISRFDDMPRRDETLSPQEIDKRLAKVSLESKAYTDVVVGAFDKRLVGLDQSLSKFDKVAQRLDATLTQVDKRQEALQADSQRHDKEIHELQKTDKAHDKMLHDNGLTIAQWEERFGVGLETVSSNARVLETIKTNVVARIESVDSKGREDRRRIENEMDSIRLQADARHEVQGKEIDTLKEFAISTKAYRRMTSGILSTIAVTLLPVGATYLERLIQAM